VKGEAHHGPSGAKSRSTSAAAKRADVAALSEKIAAASRDLRSCSFVDGDVPRLTDAAPAHRARYCCRSPRETFRDLEDREVRRRNVLAIEAGGTVAVADDQRASVACA
jgi:hypothetical protein